MSTQTEQQSTLISTAIKQISHIATLPEVTIKIIELVDDPESTAQDLHELIAYDPALCSRILKVVNSSFYGLPGQIGSINRAIVILGLNAVKNIAIAASLSKLFRGGRLTSSFSARDLWEHSIASAVATKLVADRLCYGLADEAFLAGLIHDIGFMVEIQYDRNKFIEMLDLLRPDASGVPVTAMIPTEVKVFGATHEDFGAGLCAAWKFPKTLGIVTGHHHDPLLLPAEDRPLPCMVHAADRLVAGLEHGFRMDLPSLEHDQGVLETIGLSTDLIEQIEAELPEHVENASKSLS